MLQNFLERFAVQRALRGGTMGQNFVDDVADNQRNKKNHTTIVSKEGKWKDVQRAHVRAKIRFYPTLDHNNHTQW